MTVDQNFDPSDNPDQAAEVRQQEAPEELEVSPELAALRKRYAEAARRDPSESNRH